jgi:hypothetical protein
MHNEQLQLSKCCGQITLTPLERNFFYLTLTPLILLVMGLDGGPLEH